MVNQFFKQIFHILLISMAMIAIAGCGGDKPGGIIPTKDMCESDGQITCDINSVMLKAEDKGTLIVGLKNDVGANIRSHKASIETNMDELCTQMGTRSKICMDGNNDGKCSTQYDITIDETSDKTFSWAKDKGFNIVFDCRKGSEIESGKQIQAFITLHQYPEKGGEGLSKPVLIKLAKTLE